MPDYLQGFNNISDSTLINDVRNNVATFLDYGLLQKFNYINVDIPQSGIYGGLEHRLRPVQDPRYTNGQVWQFFRNNLVWESGVGAYVSTDSTHPGISGVYVNNTFYSNSTTGTYAHYIDHVNGRVVFNTAISTSSTVTAQYSYKYINVTQSDGLGWFQRIQKDSYRSDSTDFIKQSGEWGFLAENRLQLPCIGIELLPKRNLTPYQLGGGQWAKTDIAFHCVAEDIYTRDKLIDILTMQNETTIKCFNLNDIANDQKFPIDYRGVPTSGALLYPQLLENYPGSYLRLYNFRLDSVYDINGSYVGTVKCTTEMPLGV